MCGRTSAILTCTWLSSCMAGAKGSVADGGGEGTASSGSIVCELVRLRGVRPRFNLSVPFLKLLETERSSCVVRGLSSTCARREGVFRSDTAALAYPCEERGGWEAQHRLCTVHRIQSKNDFMLKHARLTPA